MSKIETKDIYIIKNTVNDKCYIGQSVDYLLRFRKHKEEAIRNEYTYKSALYDAMNELGVNKFYVELIEKNVKNYDEKEEYYIKKYNTLVPNGYNVATGGMRYPNLSGINHHDAKIKSMDELLKIINEIKNTNKSLLTISKEHNLNFDTVQKINQGNSYRLDNIVYPIREITLSKERLDRLTFDLKYSTYSYQELSNIYNISKNTVKQINYGFTWKRDYLTYPLRQEVFIGNDTVYTKIQKDLISTNISFEELAQKYNCSETTIRRVNLGETFFQKELKYPLRRIGKLSSDDVVKIHNLLMDLDYSINEIAAKFNVSDATIKRINSGKTKKYKDSKFDYPIR